MVRDFLKKSKVLLAIAFGNFVESKTFKYVNIGVYGIGDLEKFLEMEIYFSRNRGIPLSLIPLNRLPPISKIKILSQGVVLFEKVPGLYETLLKQALDDVKRLNVVDSYTPIENKET